MLCLVRRLGASATCSYRRWSTVGSIGIFRVSMLFSVSAFGRTPGVRRVDCALFSLSGVVRRRAIFWYATQRDPFPFDYRPRR